MLFLTLWPHCESVFQKNKMFTSLLWVKVFTAVQDRRYDDSVLSERSTDVNWVVIRGFDRYAALCRLVVKGEGGAWLGWGSPTPCIAYQGMVILYSYICICIERPSADAADPNPEHITPPRPTQGDVGGSQTPTT